MDSQSAQQDLALVKDIVQKTSRRIDAHAFHCVHWGVIVLIWYPLANWFWHRGMLPWYIGIGVLSVVLGMTLSAVRSIRLGRNPRLPGGNTFISRQLAGIAFANVIAGFVLSAVSPAAEPGLEFIRGENIPILWGLIYANMAVMMGIAYNRDYLVSGTLIFLASVAAILFQDYNGYILGPFMGFGMLIPGLRAEARVRELQRGDPIGVSE
ncbi:MAG: hypothetical protein ACE5F1_07125 [Planctomycetota bacterium]